MSAARDYLSVEPERAALDAWRGPVVVEFGAPWCAHCQAAGPHVVAALAAYPQLSHLKVEDGRGKPLGRSFAVKLWPTLVFMRDGVELARLVRPTTPAAIAEALAQIAG